MFELMAGLLRDGQRFVCAAVIKTSGSSPQKPGARLLVLEDGRHFGTEGGGAFEGRILQAANEMPQPGKPTAAARLPPDLRAGDVLRRPEVRVSREAAA